MKKMKFKMIGETMIEEMTYENMDEIISNYYFPGTATERIWSNEWEEWIEPGEDFYWIDEDPMPAHHDVMEWIIEEVIQLETGDDFEDEWM